MYVSTYDTTYNNVTDLIWPTALKTLKIDINHIVFVSLNVSSKDI